ATVGEWKQCEQKAFDALLAPFDRFSCANLEQAASAPPPSSDASLPKECRELYARCPDLRSSMTPVCSLTISTTAGDVDAKYAPISCYAASVSDSSPGQSFIIDYQLPANAPLTGVLFAAPEPPPLPSPHSPVLEPTQPISLTLWTTEDDILE